MTPGSPKIAPPLVQKFDAIYELLTDFTNDTAEMHSNLAVHDDASRAAFNSLSRLLGFLDQLNMVVSLMREDVRLVDELTANPVTAQWTEEIDHCFYEWLKASKSSAPNVN
jgi:hypothetical protein